MPGIVASRRAGAERRAASTNSRSSARDAGVELGPLAAHLVDELAQPRAQAGSLVVEQRPEREAEGPPALRHRDAALEQDRPHPVQRLLVELRLRFQRDEPHGRSRRRFGDRLRVAVVVLLRLHVGLDIFRRHQPHFVALAREHPPEVMHPAAGLHRHHAGWQPIEELHELAA